MKYLWILFLLIASYFIFKSAKQTAIFKRSDTKKLKASVVDSKTTSIGSAMLYNPIYEYELDGELHRIVGNTQQATPPKVGETVTLYYNTTDNKIMEATLPIMYTTFGIVFASAGVLLSFLVS